MNKLSSTGLALMLALAAAPALAAEQELRPYFSGGYSHVFDDSQRNSDNGMGGYLSFGAPVNQLIGYEVSGFYHGFDSDGPTGAEWKDYGLKLDGLFFYSRNASFSPYFGLGVGVAKTKLETAPAGGSTDPFADIGLGFLSYLKSTDLGFRADVRYRWINPDNFPGVGNFGEPVVRVGLVVPIGERGAGSDESSLPPGSRISAGKITPNDADGDGVLNDADKCPGTPAGWLIDATGCPIDSDHDGVPDNLDKCPGTAPGVAVDAKGCPVSGAAAGPNRSFENVNFAYDKSDLTDYAKALLDNTANVIGGLVQKYPSLKIDVSGHTDWVGTDAYNQALSERRANTVKSYLTRKGVDAARINTSAFGETKPIAPNETEEGRALNRRTEVRTRE